MSFPPTGGKAGGGTQGREVKTKSTKKKGGPRNKDADSDDETSVSKSRTTELEFMSTDEVGEELAKHDVLRDCPEDLIEAIAEQLHRLVLY